MRNTLIFAGTSCPALTSRICENLGMAAADAELTQFSNVRLQSFSLRMSLHSMFSSALPDLESAE